MNRLLFFICCTLLSSSCFAQVPDFITVRKPNGRTVRHIMKGLPVVLQHRNGDYIEGEVAAIRNDSIFVRTYVARRYMSGWGVPQVDTLGTVVRPLHYRDIGRVQLNKRVSFWRRQGPVLLFVGGAGYILLNVVNGGIDFKDKANMRSLGRAGGAAVLGLALRKLFPADGFSSRRHRILYINMQVGRRPM